MRGFVISIFILSVFYIFSCSKPTLVGSELLEGDESEVGFSDTLGIRLSTVKTDSVLTYSPFVSNRVINFLCGNLDDPVFGKSSAEFYAQLRLSGDGSVILGKKIDSVILTMRYDTTGLYGNLESPVTIEVLQMTELLPPDENYYSNQSFSTEEIPLGTKSDFFPAPFDSVTLYGSDTTTFLPHIRIPLDEEFGKRLKLLDTISLIANDSFQVWFNGIRVRLTNTDNTMLSFNLNDLLSSLNVYYIDDADESKVFSFIFDAFQMVHFDHEYTGSVSEPFIGSSPDGDSLAFIQSMSGLNTMLEVDGLDALGDVLINKATLEFFATELPGDDLELFPPINQLTLQQLNDEGALENARDVNIALALGSIVVIGGNYESLDSNPAFPGKYEITLTAIMQDIQNKRIENKIFLSSFLKANFPDRVVIPGPGHPEYPTRLKVTYTKVR